MSKQKTNTQSYQQFHYRLKSRYKKQKQQRKQYLRQITYKKLAQSSQGSNDEQYLKKTGNKWWNRLNRHYFQKVTEQFVENMRIFIASEDILEFGAPISPLYSYYRDAIESLQPYIFNDQTFRVLYRHYNKISEKQKYVLAGYRCKYKTQDNKEEQVTPIFKLPSFYSFHPESSQKKISEMKDELENQWKQLDLNLCGKTQNEEFIIKCLQYQTLCKNQKLTEIQKQIASWEFQLNHQHKANEDQWQRISDLIQRQNQKYPQFKNIQAKIDQIQKFLIKSETFSYFRSGYSDKTIQQYQKALLYIKEAKLQQRQVKKTGDGAYFDTDCKVCFCTKNQNSNKVIYCDCCNTSFHQSCYGIQHIDEDKQLFCDACSYIKKMESVCKIRVPTPCCQICGRSKFPIKNMNGHFYHVSCLILFDFAQIKEFKINLKEGIKHQKIMQCVLQNQMQHYYCQYCMKKNSSGMQFKCSDTFCTKSFHPICAYLNGCIFKIARKDVGGIDVQVFCRDHTNQSYSDLAYQVYLRRFLCNFRNTSEVKEDKFREDYQRQLNKTTKGTKQQEYNQTGIKKILKLKRITTINHKSVQKKKVLTLQKSQSHVSNSNSKSGSQMPKNKRVYSQKQKSSHQRF